MLRKFKLSKTNSISIIETNWSEQSDNILKIREKVFIQEQAVPRHIEVDGKDSECIHFLIFIESVPIGTARIKMDGKIERVSILKNHRKKGLGYQLMKFIINNAKEKGFRANDMALHLGKIIEGGGGGTPDFAQAGGKRTDLLPSVIDTSIEYIKAQL